MKYMFFRRGQTSKAYHTSKSTGPLRDGSPAQLLVQNLDQNISTKRSGLGNAHIPMPNGSNNARAGINQQIQAILTSWDDENRLAYDFGRYGAKAQGKPHPVRATQDVYRACGNRRV